MSRSGRTTTIFATDRFFAQSIEVANDLPGWRRVSVVSCQLSVAKGIGDAIPAARFWRFVGDK
jgi:hypothetical protein